MTHDELLARIELWKKNVCLIPLKPKWQTEDCKCMTCVSLSALRAVVELHKPWSAGNGDASVPPVTYTPKCLYCNRIYPCETIEAIEKELR